MKRRARCFALDNRKLCERLGKIKGERCIRRRLVASVLAKPPGRTCIRRRFGESTRRRERCIRRRLVRERFGETPGRNAASGFRRFGESTRRRERCIRLQEVWRNTRENAASGRRFGESTRRRERCIRRRLVQRAFGETPSWRNVHPAQEVWRKHQAGNVASGSDWDQKKGEGSGNGANSAWFCMRRLWPQL